MKTFKQFLVENTQSSVKLFNLKSGDRFDFLKLKNARFLYCSETGELIIGNPNVFKSKNFGTHAEELSESDSKTPFDLFVRGWVSGKHSSYPNGLIHFDPPIVTTNIESFNMAFDTIKMFMKYGANNNTAIRSFGKWDGVQSIGEIFGNKINESLNNQSWQLPKELEKLGYQITTPDDFKNWKAPIIENNNSGRDFKKGDLQNCLYVLIQLDDNGVIPVPRNDEHHVGYDLLYKLKQKYKLKGRYISICALSGTYLHYNAAEDIPLIKEAFKKWLSYGGKPSTVYGYSKNKKGMILSSEFVKMDSMPSGLPSGELSGIGKEIVEQFLTLAKLDKEIVAKPERNEKMKDRFIMLSKKLAEYLHDFMYFKDYDTFKFDTYENAEKSIFTLNGLKNQIHDSLNKYGKGDDWQDTRLEEAFGDPKIALQEFNALSNI